MTQEQLLKAQAESESDILEAEIANLKSQVELLEAQIRRKKVGLKEVEYQYQAYLEQLKSNPVTTGT